MKVTGEVKVHVLHRHDLSIATACRTALDTEIRSERGITDADHRLLANAIEAVAQPHGGRRLAFAGRGRVDRSDKDQLAIGLAFDLTNMLCRLLGLVMPF